MTLVNVPGNSLNILRIGGYAHCSDGGPEYEVLNSVTDRR